MRAETYLYWVDPGLDVSGNAGPFLTSAEAYYYVMGSRHITGYYWLVVGDYIGALNYKECDQ